MRRIFRAAWKILCLLVVISFIFSVFSSFIPPSVFSFASLFGLAFPYLLLLYLLCCFGNLFINRKRALLMLVFLPAGYFNFVSSFAINRPVPWQTQKDSASLRVMTWNVQNFVNNLKKESGAEYASSREGILRTIHDYDPDVFCIQEYHNIENARRRPAIRKELDSLGYRFYYCSNDRVTTLARNKKAIVTDGVAIYSKWPLLDSGRININNIDKTESLIYIDILFSNKPLRIFTAHLQSFYIYTDTAEKYQDENIYEITYKERRNAQYRIRETEINHEAQVKIIRKAIEQSPYPVIFCGDMNTTATSYNYRLLKNNNMQDAFLEKGSGIGNTFYKIGPTLRIDVCLVNTAMQVLQCKRITKKLSDHYPVIADLKWKR